MDSITQMFSQKSVKEVMELERKTRHDIERKKEELRQMVGERYRDLIEAADTINEMKSCSENVRDSVKDLQQFCSKKSLSKQRKGVKKQQEINNVKRYMEIAAEAKFLMEMPEKIWSQVESGHMMTASFLYMQSLQVLKNLSLDGTTTYSPVLLWFPMLGQQAQAVGNLRTAILKKCHSNVHDYHLNTERLAEALCSIVLLEKISVRELFETLLESRCSALKDAVDDHVVGAQSVTTKTRICNSISVIVQTILQVFDLFCGDEGGLVGKLLQECCSMPAETIVTKYLEQTESSKIWSKHLPVDTISQLVSLDCTTLVMTSDIIQRCSIAWLLRCETEIKVGLRNLLKFTAAAKDLANIRSALFEILQEASDEQETTENIDKWNALENDSSDKTPGRWSLLCNSIFNREVNLWTEIVQEIFVEKINLLVRGTLDDLLSKTKDTFNKFLGDSCEVDDSCSYLWCEHENDISPNMAWTPWQTRKHNTLEVQSGLTFKALTVTPTIQGVCKIINHTLSDLLTDLNYYVPGLNSDYVERKPYHLRSNITEHSTSSESENKAVVDYLKAACLSFLRSLIAHVEEIGERIKEALMQENVKMKEIADQAWMISLICQNFFELCYPFKQCCCPSAKAINQNSVRRQMISGMSHSKSDATTDEDNTAWTNIVTEFVGQSHKLMTMWCDAILRNALRDYQQQIVHSVQNGNVLQSLPLWESITVEEESESGETLKSQIRIPASTTSYMQQLLYRLSHEVNCVGGYSAPRHILNFLSQECLKGIYVAFSDAHRMLSSADANLHGQNRSLGEANAPTQAWALQCLFDLRYAYALLYHTPSVSLYEDKVEQEDDVDTEDTVAAPLYTFTELVDWLEGFVDPFDLDVFSPHLSRNIQRHVTRTSVLLGILTSPDKIVSSGTHKFTSATKDSHNVLPLSADCGRFSYLPVSSRRSNLRAGQRLAPSVTRQLPLANALRDLTHSVDQDEKASQQNQLTSSLYSKLGALSSSWLSMSSSYSE